MSFLAFARALQRTIQLSPWATSGSELSCAAQQNSHEPIWSSRGCDAFGLRERVGGTAARTWDVLSEGGCWLCRPSTYLHCSFSHHYLTCYLRPTSDSTVAMVAQVVVASSCGLVPKKALHFQPTHFAVLSYFHGSGAVVPRTRVEIPLPLAAAPPVVAPAFPSWRRNSRSLGSSRP